MEKRAHDIFLDMASNPGATFDNLVVAGLTAQNTALQDRSAYEQDEWVRSQEQFKNQYGEFDKAKFDAFYNNAKVYYNALASANYDESMKRQATYHRDNISAPIEQRRQGPDYVQFEMANPYQTTSSIFELGRVGERTKSIDELAQSNKVLLNPTTAGPNLENAQWGDTPNDSFWGYFTDTLVMAQYDEDGTHTDPFTGKQVEHSAGDLKTDNNGNFYYEKLDGRDIYGRRVLNKMNVLTTDGSWANQFDFFDSDDINQKSIGGTIMKNLALVGTMFIPYVGPWIAGLSVATQLAGLTGTLGKMLTGSDSPTFSAIEGWAKSMNRQGAQTEYAQEHTWCWENFINLIGDVAGQLKEQRFIFNKVPYAIKGANMMTEEGQAAKLAALKRKELSMMEKKLGDMAQSGVSDAELLQARAELTQISALKAQANLDSFIKGYNKIGEVLSKGYMTAITVGDTYGEAKEAGASDLDATLLTLGYAAGEYAILNTGIGEWILPELRAGRYRMEAIAKALTKLDDEAKETALQSARQQLSQLTTKEGKKQYVKKLFNIGKNLARDIYTGEKATGQRTLGATLAGAMGEGVEEVSEELLADFSKGCYDVVKWLQGEDTRLNSFGYDFKSGEWNGKEVLDRYGMSLVGGFVGGGLTNLGTNYQYFKSFDKITNQQAVQELVYMARNGGIDDFMKQVNKMQLADPNMSVNYDIVDNVPVFSPGTPTNNQDTAVKTVIQNQVNMIQGILAANGAVSDSRFLDAQTLGDFRFAALHKSTTAGLYLQTYNSLLADIVRLTNNVNEVLKTAVDTNGDGVETDREQRRSKLSSDQQAAIKNMEEDIKKKKQQLQDIIEGKNAPDFISTALFEMTPYLNRLVRTPNGEMAPPTFPLFAENKYKKKYSDLTEEEKAKALEEYKNWKTTEGREQLRIMSQIYKNMAQQSSQVIRQHADTYRQMSQELLDLNVAISKFYTEVRKDNVPYYLPLVKDESDYLDLAQIASNSAPSGMVKRLPELIAKLRNREFDPTLNNIGNRILQLLGTEQDSLEVKTILDEIQTIDPNESEENQARQAQDILRRYVEKLDDILINKTLPFVQPLIDRGFANAETRNQLSQLLLVASNRARMKESEWEEWASNNLSMSELDEAVNPYSATATQLLSAARAVDSLNATPIEQNLNEFSISIGRDPINLTQLIDRLNTSFNDVSDSITKFHMDEELAKDLNNAIWTMQMYQAAIRGARTDNASLDNIFGYNATLNEVSTKVEGAEKLDLAEIDKTTADILDQDITTNLNKLEFLKRLFEVNQGQKLSKQDRVSTRKDLLIYKRLKNIVQVLDDDPLKTWEGFADLQSAINGMTLHEEMLSTNNNIIPESQKEAFEKEKIAAENAIYDFFQIESNKKKLEDPTMLAQLINPRKLQLYTEAKELLTEGLENLDDNSIVWWLASRIALRSTDFYHQYRQIIDPEAARPLAPISTQELAIYNNYASIVNGNVFSNFYKAHRLAMIEDWKGKSVAERQEILRKLGKDDVLSSDALAPYAINFLPTPRYQNIMLTEGIPGSGKSTGVFQSTLRLVRQFHPDMLKNVMVIHGANADSATKLRNDIGLDENNSTAYGREAAMKEITPTWVEYARNDKDNSYQVPESDYTITSENEIRSKLGVKDTTTPPSLIIIDEVSKFTAYDLDQIDKFAQKYGITVLAAGDFDQSGVVGSHKLPGVAAFNGMTWQIDLNRTNFIRSPKLGVSMRTDNSLKTQNLAKFQTYMQNPTGEKIDFNYFEDETGLYGDKVLSYNLDVTRNSDTDAISRLVVNKEDLLPQIRTEVQKLVNTLAEGEKIGYIYNDKTSPIYGMLSSEFGDNIDFKEGGSAQGLEGRYYIVEADFHDSVGSSVHNVEDLKALYTGMSRAQQGALIIAPFTDDRAAIKVNSVATTQKVNETLSTNSIANFAKKRKTLLDAVASDGNVPDPIARTAEVQSPQADPQTTPQPNTAPDSQELGGALDPTPPPAPEATPTNTATEETVTEEVPAQQPESEPQVPENTIDQQAKELKDKVGLDVDAARNVLNSDNLFIGGLELDNLPPNARYVDSHGLAKGNEIENLLNLLTNGIDPNRRFDSAPLGRATGEGEAAGQGAALGTAGGTSYRGGMFIVAAQQSESFGEGYNLLTKTGIKTVLINTGDPDTPRGREIAQKLKEELSKMFPEIDFILYTEAADYYNTQQPEVAEPPAPETPQVQSLVYEEDPAPIIQQDVINETVYQQQIDQASETKDPAKSTVEVSQDRIFIDMLLHTFNTFETGVGVDENGMPVPIGSQQWMDSRIDSVNGLVRIDKTLGNPIRTVEEYTRMIGRLRSIMFNTADKARIEEKLQTALGLSGIYCTFALKSSPRASQDNRESGREFVGNTPNPFDKGVSEKTQFNGSKDFRSDEWHNKSIVAIIGTKTQGNLLELPLMALSSPFTLIQTQAPDGSLAYGQMANHFNQLVKQNVPLHEISNIMVQQYSNIAQYKELVDLFKLFNFTDGAVFYMDDPQWTPAKDLQLKGPQFVTDAGYYQIEAGLSMNDMTNPESEWLTLTEFARDPQLKMTSSIMVSQTGYVDGISDKPIVNAGHPFVLVSYNRDLNTDKKIIEQYIKQQSDPSVRNEVKLVYVLPPKASIKEYLANVHKILSKDTDYQYIGNLFTSYKLLKVLMQDEKFRTRVEEKLEGATPLIEQAFRDLENLSQDEQKNRLYDKRDWTQLGFGNQRLAGLFDAVIQNIAYSRKSVGREEYSFEQNVDDTKIIEEALSRAGIDGVYYHAKFPKEADGNDYFTFPIQKGYTIDGTPNTSFRIHGKLDSYTFSGRMGDFVDMVLNKIRVSNSFRNKYTVDQVLSGQVQPGDNVHLYSDDSKTYVKFQNGIGYPGNSDLTASPVVSPQMTQDQIARKNTIDYVKNKLNIDVTSIFEGRPIQEANKLVVEKINSENHNAVAFTIGNDLLISNVYDILGGPIYLYDSNQQPITDISQQSDNNGKYIFTLAHTVDGREVTAQVEYDSSTKELSLMDPVETAETPQAVHVTAENFGAYVESGVRILEQIFPLDPFMEDIFKADSPEAMIEAMQNKIWMGEEIIKSLEELLPQADELQTQIINDLIANERAIDPTKEDEVNQICPPVIKIKF